jgi:hypothetical protein
MLYFIHITEAIGVVIVWEIEIEKVCYLKS